MKPLTPRLAFLLSLYITEAILFGTICFQQWTKGNHAWAMISTLASVFVVVFNLGVTFPEQLRKERRLSGRIMLVNED